MGYPSVKVECEDMGYLRRSTCLTRVKAIAPLAPLNADVEAFKVLAVELGLGILGSLLGLILNECVGALEK